MDVNRLEVGSNSYFKPFLSFRHFANIFEQLLCVRHFSGCWLRQSGTMHDRHLHETYILINNSYYRTELCNID